MRARQRIAYSPTEPRRKRPKAAQFQCKTTLRAAAIPIPHIDTQSSTIALLTMIMTHPTEYHRSKEQHSLARQGRGKRRQLRGHPLETRRLSGREADGVLMGAAPHGKQIVNVGAAVLMSVEEKAAPPYAQ